MVGTAQQRLCPPYGYALFHGLWLTIGLWKRSEDMSNDKKVTVGSGNVFADLGFANPEEELLKAKLIREIRSIIKRRKLTQAKAAILLGLKQPDVSSIITGRVGKFSLDRLVRCLDRLDYKVDVVVRHKPRRASRAIAA
jgi:predicted XRE-type DNA-binding protein